MKPLWIAVIGALLFLAAALFFRYSVAPTGGGTTGGPFIAVKLDRLTGRTWVLRGYHWRSLETEKESGPEPAPK